MALAQKIMDRLQDLSIALHTCDPDLYRASIMNATTNHSSASTALTNAPGYVGQLSFSIFYGNMFERKWNKISNYYNYVSTGTVLRVQARRQQRGRPRPAAAAACS